MPNQNIYNYIETYKNPPFMNNESIKKNNLSLPSNVEQTALKSVSRKLILQKFTIYQYTKNIIEEPEINETNKTTTTITTDTGVFIVGSNGRETIFKIIRIHITDSEEEEEEDKLREDQKIQLIEDNEIYTKSEISQLLTTLNNYNENLTDSSPLRRLGIGFSLLGFIKFTKGYYLNIVTKRSAVAVVGGKHIYHIDDTKLIPINDIGKTNDKYSEEARYLAIFKTLDLSRTFYFSYTYDVTNTLQRNLLREKQKSLGLLETDKFNYGRNEMYIWNHALLEHISISKDFNKKKLYDWFQPIIHGFIDQSNVSIFGKKIYITLIARRSKYFAGARFLKRGVNNQGNVANEVESEQIVSDMQITGLHESSMGFFDNKRYTSYVQHRGSIPLNWSQEAATNLKLAKPPIEITQTDPFFTNAALHFDDLYKRYDSPILVLNLIKSKERTPRESKLLKEFEKCIQYLNQFQVKNKDKLQYTHWDMSKASKYSDGVDGQDVIEYLENYADSTINSTGIFHNNSTINDMQLQQGICRTNCIDCLDRTNAAQFIIGKRALGYQLHALGVIDDIYINYDSDVVNILTEMFHDHGDTIALQYGGSHLVNTMETYRKINQWSSHSRDMIESIKRFYSNSFMDAQRQEAVNLFLGNFKYEQGRPMLWDFETDYYLHNETYTSFTKKLRSYRYWWTDKNLLTFRETYNLDKNETREKLTSYPGFFDNYWNEYYTPRKLTVFEHVFEMNMNSTSRYITPQDTIDQRFEFSPFKPRKLSLINHKLRRLEVKKKRKQEEEAKQKENLLLAKNSEKLTLDELAKTVSINNLKELKDKSLEMERLILRSSHDLGFDHAQIHQNEYDALFLKTNNRDNYEPIETITVNSSDYKLYQQVTDSTSLLSAPVSSYDFPDQTFTTFSSSDDEDMSRQLNYEVLSDDLKLYKSVTNLGLVGDYLNANILEHGHVSIE